MFPSPILIIQVIPIDAGKWQTALRHLRYSLLERKVSIAPLIGFRILFGSMMFIGVLRFMLNGWVEKLYVTPKLFFKFYGFHWVQSPGEIGIYILFGIIALSALMIALGFFYRLATLLFFLCFTYIELLDATNYLNHYYLVCLLGFILIWLPANGAFSLDNALRGKISRRTIPSWCINIIIFQLTLVYTFAGIAKLNPDWIFRAMPLSIWLPEHQDLPLLGGLFKYKATAFFFSWMGALYDLTIAYFLMWKRTRTLAYAAVIGFHVLTGILFNIGMFPIIMITSTLIFFSADFHKKWLKRLGFHPDEQLPDNVDSSPVSNTPLPKFLTIALGFYILLQLALPFRALLYPGNLHWTEEGYRFSWRVMLVEKIGQATFYIQDSGSERQQEVVNGSYLTQFQEKQMSIQPDFILQFAHFLKNEYEQRHGFIDPKITVDAHVALNGRISQQFINPDTNLAEIKDGFRPKKWILPFQF